MSIRYDKNRKRIICRWAEPTKVVMNKEEGLINRSRMISVKVNDNGRLNSRDILRHQEHPMLGHVVSFYEKLSTMNFFPEKNSRSKCAACGSRTNVSPHYDHVKQKIVWLCPEHLGRL